MTQQQPIAYHLVAYEFAGRDRAAQVVDIVRKERRAGGYKVAAWAVLEVDERGKSNVRQSGSGGMGAVLGGSGGALLSLIGGPAGLLAWALGGALVGGLAGKHFGRLFDVNQLKAIGAGMEPNSSALVVIVEDTALQKLAGEMGEMGAAVISLTIGSQLSGEVAQFAAIELGEESDAPAA
ncbi:DUF1269 domain-containing protein [Promineifilum sp.]|uniref:DUF1269 domain-containing protein n=1 Tax=Promineifilum sp. TaxID=2664178 RepID=UPI0035AED9D4